MNEWIRANWSTYYDGLVDVAAAPELQDPNNPTYFQPDTVHLTTAGYRVVATLAAKEMMRVSEND